MRTSFILAALLGMICAPSGFADEAADAWNRLVGRRMAQRPAFAMVEHKAALPNVLIYGDSISIAYTPVVREVLQGKANVYRLHCNGGSSDTVLPKLAALREAMRSETLENPWDFAWDVVFLNVGLHDLKHVDAQGQLSSDGERVNPIEVYSDNLRKVIPALREWAPQATIVFATTTPVPENSRGRIAGDAARYNDAARAVLEDHPDVVICDLYELTRPHHEAWWSAPGNVHFNEQGVRAQGRHVAEVIEKVLAARAENDRQSDQPSR